MRKFTAIIRGIMNKLEDNLMMPIGQQVQFFRGKMPRSHRSVINQHKRYTRRIGKFGRDWKNIGMLMPSLFMTHGGHALTQTSEIVLIIEFSRRSAHGHQVPKDLGICRPPELP